MIHLINENMTTFDRVISEVCAWRALLAALSCHLAVEPPPRAAVLEQPAGGDGQFVSIVFYHSRGAIA